MNPRLLGLTVLNMKRRKRRHGGGAPTGAVVYASDAFNRSDRNLNGDAAEVGGNWTVWTGTHTISSNQYSKSSAAAQDALYLDDGQADGVWRVKLAGTISQQGQAIRQTASNTWVSTMPNTTQVFIKRFTAGVITTIGAYTGPIAAGDVIRLDAQGSTLNLLVNDVLRIGPVTETQGQTATKSGMVNNFQTSTKLDDYSHKSA
jgi:hypothetical protein